MDPPPGWTAPFCPPSALGPPGHGGIRVLDRPPGPARPPQYLQGLPQLLPASQFPPQPLDTGHWGAAGVGVAAPSVLGVVAHGVPPPPPINVVEEFLLVQP